MTQAKTETPIGIIGPETPIGSIITLEDDTRYEIVAHTMGGVSLKEADGEIQDMSYDEWTEEFAPFVSEIRYPEPIAPAAAPMETPVAQPAEPHLPTSPPSMNVNAALLIDVSDARQALCDTQAEFDVSDEHTKAKKKERDKAQESLNQAVDMLLCGQVTREGWPVGAPLAAAAAAAVLLGDEPFASPHKWGDLEAWKLVPLADLTDPAIKPGILKALAQNDPPLTTLGELTAWQADKGEWWAKDIKGVGKAAQDVIADATDSYWARVHEAMPK